MTLIPQHFYSRIHQETLLSGQPTSIGSLTTGRAGTGGKAGAEAAVSWQWYEKMQPSYCFTSANNTRHACHHKRTTVFLVKIFPTYLQLQKSLLMHPISLVSIFNPEACILSILSPHLLECVFREMQFLHTLITGTRGLNLEDSCVSTSPSSCWCFKTFLIFMILTIAACKVRNVCLGANYFSFWIKPFYFPSRSHLLAQKHCHSKPYGQSQA